MARSATRNWVSAGTPRWLGDFSSRDHLVPGGVKLDAALFPVEDAVTATVGAAGAPRNATSIPVAALSGKIPNGTTLDFGPRASQTVIAGAGGAAIGATSIPVNALAAPIPSGTVLDFTGAGEFALLTADAATGATALTVEALDVAIEAGDTAVYAGVSRRFAGLTAEAAAGATALAVEALAEPLYSGDAATYPGTGKRYVPAGTILGLTQAELDAGAAWGPVADGDDHVRILRFGVEDVADDNDGVLVRPFGTVIKYNLLPQAPLSATRVTQLRQAGYVLQRGVA